MTSKLTKVSITAAAVLTIFTGAVSAQAADVRPVKQVDIGMLNLASPQGLGHAKLMIRQAAKSVCFTEASQELTIRNEQKRCYKAAVTDAYAKADSLRLAQISGAQGQRLASVEVGSNRTAR